MSLPFAQGSSTPGAGQGARLRVLVVDDQPLNIQSLYRVFADDHQVLMATSGEKALQICREAVPDLVLLDVVMPGMDGYEVLNRMKADPVIAHVPVIFVTARDAAEDEAKGLALGAVDYIAKPINPAIVRARTRTHLDLARSRALLRATLEATADGIVVTDVRGGFVTCNQRFLRMWGISPSVMAEGSESCVLRFMQSQIEDGQTDFQDLIDKVQQCSDDMPSDVRLRDGRVFQRHLTALQTSGRVTGLVFSFRDISARIRAEQALAELNADLESKVRKRTESLARATRIASEASQAKSEFLSNMSHEMRTPLNSVLGMAYLAMRADPTPRIREYLERVQESGRHLLGLISNVLDFAKIEAGRLELESIDFSVPALVDEVVKQLSEVADQKGLRIDVRIDAQLAQPVRGDPLRLRQVLINYASNAVKFSSAGVIQVRASIASEDMGGAEVLFEVEDHGIGMTSVQTARIFKAFEQADASTTRKFGGTGLGLAICRQLAVLMGGEVGVDSEPGVGSTFWFRVPLMWGDALPVALPVDEGEGWRWNASLSGRTLLVVDDNVLNQRVASELLEAAGAQVSIAGNGAEALQALEGQRPDCVLMDVQMPVMDGLEASRRIRQAGGLSQLPIIAMTANARQEDQQACLDSGMNDFVTKPVDPEQLYMTLTKWLGNSSAGAQPPADERPPEAASQTQPAADSVASSDSDPGPAASEPASANGDAQVDLSALTALTRNNPKMMQDIAGVFVGFMERTVTEMQAALAAGDRKQLSALGHKAKSSAASVGAKGLSQLCQELEKSMKEEAAGLEAARALVDRIAAASPAVCGALSSLHV